MRAFGSLPKRQRRRRRRLRMPRPFYWVAVSYVLWSLLLSLEFLLYLCARSLRRTREGLYDAGVDGVKDRDCMDGL